MFTNSLPVLKKDVHLILMASNKLWQLFVADGTSNAYIDGIQDDTYNDEHTCCLSVVYWSLLYFALLVMK